MEETGMNCKQISMVRKGLRLVISILALGVSVSADAGFLGIGGNSWKEEVLLHDGSKIIVTRTVERGGRHEIGQKPPYKEQHLSFTLPATGEHVTWTDKFSEDVGSANFLPMLFDMRDSEAYLVASPMGCLSYNKWGRPNPPYVVFIYQDKEWKRIPLQELPPEIKTPNLIFSSPDTEVEKSGKSFVSAEMIKAITARYEQPEFKTILRGAYPGASGNCGEMVRTSGGGWIGIGWFRDQPSREACLKYCAFRKVDAKYCPCETIFERK
jgi:hypothetical protein